MRTTSRIVFLSLMLSLFLSVSALAVDGKAVSYKSGDDTVNGILYTPAGHGPFPALIVIHEWWGLNDWVKQQAGKLADQGYVALAVDLVSRQGCRQSRPGPRTDARLARRPGYP